MGAVLSRMHKWLRSWIGLSIARGAPYREDDLVLLMACRGRRAEHAESALERFLAAHEEGTSFGSFRGTEE